MHDDNRAANDFDSIKAHLDRINNPNAPPLDYIPPKPPTNEWQKNLPPNPSSDPLGYKMWCWNPDQEPEQ